ncbi:class F sortase [Actinotalea caeni]|uniref:class F sortase n=1 Tax=Actinotalea caeni TaxID=1348467 RepID=UPI0012E29040|nr:class F sortase [Actinotalea caeni]
MTHLPTSVAARALGARAATAALLVLIGATACGGPQAEPEVTPSTVTQAAAAGEEPTVPPSSGPTPEVPRVDATQPQQPAVAGSPPAVVEIDDLGIEVPVVPVGVAADGQAEVPPDANEAGWYRFGPGVGSDRGATVVLAHAGSRLTPRGPFRLLEDLDGGETVVVTAADGSEHTFVVTSVEVLEKATLDLAPYFVRDGEPHLVLITCGGQWDPAAESYRSNVIVTAVPA